MIAATLSRRRSSELDLGHHRWQAGPAATCFLLGEVHAWVRARKLAGGRQEAQRTPRRLRRGRRSRSSAAASVPSETPEDPAQHPDAVGGHLSHVDVIAAVDAGDDDRRRPSCRPGKLVDRRGQSDEPSGRAAGRHPCRGIAAGRAGAWRPTERPYARGAEARRRSGSRRRRYRPRARRPQAGPPGVGSASGRSAAPPKPRPGRDRGTRGRWNGPVATTTRRAWIVPSGTDSTNPPPSSRNSVTSVCSRTGARVFAA